MKSAVRLRDRGGERQRSTHAAKGSASFSVLLASAILSTACDPATSGGNRRGRGVPVDLRVSLPPLPESTARALADATEATDGSVSSATPLTLLLRVRETGGPWQQRALSPGEKVATFEVVPGPLEFEALFIAAARRDRACDAPEEVSYFLARGRTARTVTENDRTVALAVSGLAAVPFVPGGALVRAKDAYAVQGGDAVAGVTLIPLDPQWDAPLPSACPGKELGAVSTGASGIASLRLPLFPGYIGEIAFRTVAGGVVGRAVLPAPSARTLSVNLHRLVLDGAGSGVALVDRPRDAVAEFGAAFFAGLTGPVDAKRICSGTTLLGVAGTAACDVPARPADCTLDGAVDCVATAAFPAASTSTLATKVVAGQSVAGVSGNVVLPGVGDVRAGVTYGPASAVMGTYAPDFPDAANVRAGDTVNGAAGTLGDCSADGATACVVPSSGSFKAADTASFSGWDIRRKRNPTTGAVITFAGLAGQSKACRNRASTALFDNTTSPAAVGLDVFDTIDDYRNNLTGLPGEIPAWTLISSVDYGADYACGGIYATGSTATGNTGADESLAHDPNGNWQDLTPGVLPGGANSTNTANGCNATDKHCVFKELVSGLMVTEVSATTHTWANGISYCHTLGESGNPVVALRSPIPVIGGATFSDWRLPTQKELMQLYQGGVRGLNQTTSLTTFFGDVVVSIWSSTSSSEDSTNAWYADTLARGFFHNGAGKGISLQVVCVR
jgi:hypothetical protein